MKFKAAKTCPGESRDREPASTFHQIGDDTDLLQG